MSDMNGIALIMNRKIFIALLVALLTVGGSFAIDILLSKGVIARAASSNNVYGWAWSDNVGWISFSSANCDLNGDGTSDNVVVGKLHEPLYLSSLAVVDVDSDGADDYVYLFGGRTNFFVTNTIYRAPVSDPTNWSNAGGTPLPSGLYGSQLAVVDVDSDGTDDYVYLFGGSLPFGSASKIIYRAPVSDPTNWSNTGAPLTNGLAHSQSAVIGGYIYLFGGYEGPGTITNMIFRAPVSDPTNWINTNATLPGSLYAPQLAVIGDHVYLFGGRDAFSNSLNTIYSAPVSDPTNWINTGATLTNGLAHSQLKVIGDYVYLFGGYEGPGSITNMIFRAPVSDPLRWVNTGAKLPVGLVFSSIATIGDRVYLFGGVEGETGVATDSIFSAPLSNPLDWILDGTTLPGCPLGGTPIPPYGVTIDDFTGDMTGYAWSDNVGWIAFGESNEGGDPFHPDAYSNNGSPDAIITGWARALSAIDAQAGGWDGWISLDCESAIGEGDFAGCGTSNYQVGITEGKDFYGHAWGGDVIGWIEFSPAKGGVHKKSPQTLTLTANPAVVGDGQNTELSWFGSNSFNTCTASANPGVLNWGGPKSVPTITQVQSDVGPFTGVGNTYQLSLHCEGLAGEARADTSVTVSPAGFYIYSPNIQTSVTFIGTGGAVAKTTIVAVPFAGYATPNRPLSNITLTLVSDSPELPPGSTVTFSPFTSLDPSQGGDSSASSVMTVTFSKAPAGLPKNFAITIVGSDGEVSDVPDSYLTVDVAATRVQTGFKNF